MNSKLTRVFIYMSLLIGLQACSSPVLIDIDAKAGRDIKVKGQGANVNIKRARAGRDVSICADKGLTLPSSGLKAPRDISLSTDC